MSTEKLVGYENGDVKYVDNVVDRQLTDDEIILYKPDGKKVYNRDEWYLEEELQKRDMYSYPIDHEEQGLGICEQCMRSESVQEKYGFEEDDMNLIGIQSPITCHVCTDVCFNPI